MDHGCQQPAVSSNPRNPSEQSSAGKPDKSAEQVSPVNANKPANPGKPPEQVNPVNKVNPVEQGKPDDKQANPTNPGNEKQCPSCSCLKKEGNEKLANLDLSCLCTCRL